MELMKKLDFLILVEHVSRELESAERLALELTKLGLKGAIFPLHYMRYYRLIKAVPSIVVAPFFYSAKNTHHINYKMLYGDVDALDLHAEQICDETTKNMRMPQDDYARSIYHISWTEKFASYLISCGVNEKDIMVTGCNRCDRIHENKVDVDVDILICTSFSRTFVSECYIDQMLEKLSFDRELYLKKIKFTEKVRDAYFSDIYNYSQKYKNKKIHVRPHPYVSISDFTNKFLEVNNISLLPSNISIIREGSIQNAIDRSKMIVAWQSSVILDARLAGKRCLMLEPFATPDYMKISFSDAVPKITSLFDISAKVHDYYSLDQYIYEVYGLVDGKSSERIASWIAKIVLGQHRCQKPRIIPIFKAVLKSIFVDVTILLLLKVDMLTKVFPLYKGLEEDCFYPVYFLEDNGKNN